MMAEKKNQGSSAARKQIYVLKPKKNLWMSKANPFVH